MSEIECGNCRHNYPGSGDCIDLHYADQCINNEYHRWEPLYRCFSFQNESGRNCIHFSKPEGCTLNEYRWCRRDWNDNGDTQKRQQYNQVKKMKEIFK